MSAVLPGWRGLAIAGWFRVVVLSRRVDLAAVDVGGAHASAPSPWTSAAHLSCRGRQVNDNRYAEHRQTYGVTVDILVLATYCVPNIDAGSIYRTKD